MNGKVMEKFEKFVQKMKTLSDGTTIKIVKEEKTLVEIDGDLFGQVIDILMAYNDFDEEQSKQYEEIKFKEMLRERERA